MENNEDYVLLSKSRYFDKNYYLKKHPELKLENTDLITHYLNTGWIKGYNPSALFDGNAYLQKNSDVKDANINPLVHYLRYGIKEGRAKALVQEEVEANNSNEYFRQTMPMAVYEIYKKIHMGEC